MKIDAIRSTGLISSDLGENLHAERCRLLRLVLGRTRGLLAIETDRPEDWPDDSVVGMRGWFY
jgi:hypothetical protein